MQLIRPCTFISVIKFIVYISFCQFEACVNLWQHVLTKTRCNVINPFIALKFHHMTDSKAARATKEERETQNPET